ncbi:UNVERIFIED_CONTAM: hypothetical protein GTU68_021388 [Idotea baltica]|nr:hypothetical protein [Idotea baltica]
MSTKIEHLNNAPGAPTPVGAYSQAVKVGDVVHLAGQIGIAPETGELVSGGIKAEALQVFENIRAVLMFAGSSPVEIVMCSIFLAEMSDAKEVNQLYSSFINPESAPARQTVAVKELPLGALIEISVIAAC